MMGDDVRRCRGAAIGRLSTSSTYFHLDSDNATVALGQDVDVIVRSVTGCEERR